ncbi:MAG: hypothetical protein AAGF31_06935 [Planctomycetota bacterium]
MTLRDWGILYGIAMSTIALAIHGWKLWVWWRDRERLSIRISSFGKGAHPVNDETNKRYSYISISIKNQSPSPVFVENIGYTQINGHDHLIHPQELPVELEGFRTLKFHFWEGWQIANGATRLFAIDGRGKKHEANREELQRAIDLAARAKDECDEQGISVREYLEKSEGILK